MTFFEVSGAATRAVLRRPSVSLAVFVTLALGIGLTTSLFSIVNAVLWRPLPVDDPERAVWVETVDGGETDGSSPGLLFAWQERARSLRAIAGIRAAHATIEYADGIDRVAGAFVSAAYFDAVGVRASQGSVFGRDLDRAGSEPVVVLSHRLWQQRFGREEIIGRVITFNGAGRTVIGIMPASLDELGESHAWWAPLSLPESQRANLKTTYLDVVGRLAPGVTAETAREELTAIAGAVGVTASNGSPRGVRLTALGSHLTGVHRPTLLLLFGAVIVMLVIACANVATLLLTDGFHRHTEMAVRAALGASRAQLIGLALMEALVVAVGASAFGVLLAHWFNTALLAILPAAIPRLALADVDRTAVLFAVCLGVASALAGAALPAWRSGRVRAGDALRSRGDLSESGSLRLRRTFVVGQVALTTGLLVSGALLLQSTRSLERAPRGYQSGVLTSAFGLPAYAFPDPQAQAAAFDRLLQAADFLPGVSHAAIGTRVPLAGGGAGSDVVRLDEGFDARSDRQVRIRLVSPGFFTTMGIPVVQGREILPGDGRRGQRVAVVNETLSRRLATSETALGTPVKFALREFNDEGRVTPWEVVGIVADTFDQGPRGAVTPEIFVPLAQAPLDVLAWLGNQAILAVRGPGDVSAVVPALRAEVARAGLKSPLYDIQTVDERMASHLARERAVSGVLTTLSACGVSLSGFGIFVVIHDVVRRRRREMALRLALGASPSSLTASVVRETVAMTSAGLAAGFLLFVMLSGAIRPLLFGIDATDPVTLAVVAVVVVVIGIVSAVIPARSVARLEPSSVLREL